MTTRSGGCLCGAVRYEIRGKPRIGVTCHCRDCQYISGGGPTPALVVRREDFAIVTGATRVHWTAAESGTRVAREFCEACGTPLSAHNERSPDLVAVKVGSLDDGSDFRPQLQIWTGSAPSWHKLDRAVPRFRGNPKVSLDALLELVRVGALRLSRMF